MGRGRKGVKGTRRPLNPVLFGGFAKTALRPTRVSYYQGSCNRVDGPMVGWEIWVLCMGHILRFIKLLFGVGDQINPARYFEDVLLCLTDVDQCKWTSGKWVHYYPLVPEVATHLDQPWTELWRLATCFSMRTDPGFQHLFPGPVPLERKSEGGVQTWLGA